MNLFILESITIERPKALSFCSQLKKSKIIKLKDFKNKVKNLKHY